MSTFGVRLKELRTGKNLAQKEVGAIIGVSDSSIRKYESGDRTPTPDALKTLAKFFDVSVDYLLGSDATPSKNMIEEKKPKDLQKILEDHEIMFDGIPLDDDEKQEILDIIQYKLYKRAKELNKRKK